MYNRQHRISRKPSDSHDAPASNQLAPRPFVVQPQTEEVKPPQNQTADLQAKGEKTKEVSDGFPDASVFTRHVAPPRVPRVQMKLTIGKVGDKYEQEADKMAANVVQQINAPESQSIQQEALPEDQKDSLQAKPIVQSLSGSPLVQLMKIRGTAKSVELSNDTAKKHVKPLSEQEASAVANYTGTTFVTEAKAIADVVDADTHNFTEPAGEASDRHDINGNVKIYQWDKTEGVGKNKPVEKTIDGVATNCEIGVKKGGDDKIKVTHFQKI